jgi:hypothetical protein
MRQCSVNPRQHNLNIHMYKFSELLELFKLNYESTVEDIKEARKIVLKMHPDKSRLSGDYFLFYKKAFEIVVDYFREQQKTQKPVPKTEQLYTPLESKLGAENDQQVTANIGKMVKQGDFQKQFNQLYEDNMAKKPDESRNAWFKNNDPLFEFDGPKSAKDIAASIEQVKAKTAAMVAYKGVQEMNSSVGTSKYFDDDDEEDANSYVTCDPFSKLKFDDLRKVHKDQTVFAVSEADYAKMDRYASIDQLTQLRSEKFSPMERKSAEHQMAQQEELMKQQAAARQHAAQLRSMQYEEKNKSVLSNFLRLQG